MLYKKIISKRVVNKNIIPVFEIFDSIMNDKNFDFSNNFIIEKDDNECYSFYYPFTHDNSFNYKIYRLNRNSNIDETYNCYLGKNNMIVLNKLSMWYILGYYYKGGWIEKIKKNFNCSNIFWCYILREFNNETSKLPIWIYEAPEIYYNEFLRGVITMTTKGAFGTTMTTSTPTTPTSTPTI